MKRNIKFFAILMAGVLLFASCDLFNKSYIKGYKKTKSGLHYKFDKQNKDGQQVNIGDVLIGEMVVRMDDQQFFSNEGKPDRIYHVEDSVFHDSKIDEGLLMMHVGEKASFAIFADSIFKYFSPNQMPQGYQRGKGQIIYYDINLTDILTREEYEQEQANFYQMMEERKKQEKELIANYVLENKINVTPTSEGLYVIVRKRGNGTPVAMGREVKMNYTGRLLDGKVFDSSVESVGREAGLDRPTYEPLSYTVGKMSLIKGWEQGIAGLPQGSQVTLIIPSSLGYGAQGAGQLIEPYSPLVFDIDILSVK